MEFDEGSKIERKRPRMDPQDSARGLVLTTFYFKQALQHYPALQDNRIDRRIGVGVK